VNSQQAEQFPQDQIPTDAEIAAEHDKDNRAILAAMQRIMQRRPLHAPIGSFEINDLAQEAQLGPASNGYGRHRLYARKDSAPARVRSAALRERYSYLTTRDIEGRKTERERELETELAEAKEKIAELDNRRKDGDKERSYWVDFSHYLARQIVTQSEELCELQETLAMAEKDLERLKASSHGGPSGNVVSMPSGGRLAMPPRGIR